ncbi:hypothetical protein GF362_07120 [Candidatus Dojkabacteria bacterium]|nr:hypothetical protein [Candidatus Dojkabacteria bacterium]
MKKSLLSIFSITLFLVFCFGFFNKANALMVSYEEEGQKLSTGLFYCTYWPVAACWNDATEGPMTVAGNMTYRIQFSITENEPGLCVKTRLQYPEENIFVIETLSKNMTGGSKVLNKDNWYNHKILDLNGKEAYIPEGGEGLVFDFFMTAEQAGQMRIAAIVEVYDETCSIKLDTIYPTLDISVLFPAEEKDVSQEITDIGGTMFESHIRNLLKNHIVSGYSDNTYRPNSEVTRAQMAKFVLRSFDFTVNRQGEQFPDNPIDLDSYEVKLSWYVQTLKNLGIVNGYTDGNYYPNRSVTRGALCKYVVESLKEKGYEVPENLTADYPDVPDDYAFSSYIAYLSQLEVGSEKVVKGYSDGTFKPDQPVTRGQMAKVIDNIRIYLEQ